MSNWVALVTDGYDVVLKQATSSFRHLLELTVQSEIPSSSILTSMANIFTMSQSHLEHQDQPLQRVAPPRRRRSKRKAVMEAGSACLSPTRMIQPHHCNSASSFQLLEDAVHVAMCSVQFYHQRPDLFRRRLDNLLTQQFQYELHNDGRIHQHTDRCQTLVFQHVAESGSSPCSQLSALSTNNATFFPADLALSCLRSVPLAKQDDILQLKGLRTFLEFQSDLEYLADPTIGRIYPGVDLLAGLDKLTSMLQDDIYDNEYDFQLDIFKLFSSAYDGHLSYTPDIVDVFAFARLQNEKLNDEGIPAYFSLISKDTLQEGTINLKNRVDIVLFSNHDVVTGENETPDIYAYSDEAALTESGYADYSPSPITKINGEDVLAWVNSYASQNGRSQDPDANYNGVFLNIPALAYQDIETNYFAVSRFYQGDNTVLTFANGSTLDVMTRAQLLSGKTLEGVTDGASFFDRFCNNNLTASILAQANSSTTPSQTASNDTLVPFEPVSTEGVAPPHPAYPSPVVIASDNSVAGYLSDTHPELAILSVPSFSAVDEIEFENVVRQFLATANDEERTKLVIDLRGNGGGDVFLAYDLFRQLFPTETPYGTGNYRASELHNATGLVLNSFNYRESLTVDDEQFTSWEDFFGPHQNDRGNYTSLNRFNLTDVSATTVPITGYADDDATQPRTFSSQDIVLLHDGTCASTCAIFSEFMTSQMETWSVVVGGRPQNEPMQGVGGVKGSQVQGMFILSTIISAVISAAPLGDQLSFLGEFGTDLISATQQALNRASPGGALFVQASVNFRNNIRKGDESETPLQHIYEAADCRFFYTPEMYSDQAAVWNQAYDSTWGSMECVEGSTEHPSSVSEGGNITAGPPEMARNFFGGNRTIDLGGELGSVWKNASSGDGDSGSGPGNDTKSGNGTTGGKSDNEDDESGAGVLGAPFLLATSLAFSSLPKFFIAASPLM
ncbi:hypothetical protein KCU85_g16, partial [Aureobasidium melanogenum]